MPRAWPRWSISCVIYDRVPRWGARTLLHVYISHVSRPLDGWRFVCHQPWPTRGDKSCMRIPWFSQRGQLLSSRVECARMDGRCRLGGESSRIRATVYYRINTNIGPVSQRTCHVLPIRFSDSSLIDSSILYIFVRPFLPWNKRRMEVRNKRLTRCRARVSTPNLRPEIIYLIINLITFVRPFNSKKRYCSRRSLWVT